MKYRALVIKEDENKKRSYGLGSASLKNISANEITVKVLYSSINMFDVNMVEFNNPILNNKYPKVTGIDATGIVVNTKSPDFALGDEVIVTGYSLGTDINGGFGDYINIPSSIAIKLPMGLTLYESMAIGTEGLTATLAVIQLINIGLINKDKDNNVLVTGGVNGVGAIAVALLDKLGFKVSVVANNLDDSEYLSIIGADTIIHKDKFLETIPNDKLFLDKYIAGIDTYGGAYLSRMISSIKKDGSIVSCGMLMSSDFTSSIYPLLFRGINILGIDGINCHIDAKKYAWTLLSGEWKLNILSWLSNEIALKDVTEYCARMSHSKIKGKIVINHAL